MGNLDDLNKNVERLNERLTEIKRDADRREYEENVRERESDERSRKDAEQAQKDWDWEYGGGRERAAAQAAERTARWQSLTAAEKRKYYRNWILRAVGITAAVVTVGILCWLGIVAINNWMKGPRYGTFQYVSENTCIKLVTEKDDKYNDLDKFTLTVDEGISGKETVTLSGYWGEGDSSNNSRFVFFVAEKNGESTNYIYGVSYDSHAFFAMLNSESKTFSNFSGMLFEYLDSYDNWDDIVLSNV